jgi:hypothetical protein
MQGLQPPDRSADPIGEGRAIQFDAMPRKDLALSIQREVIAVFGDEDMGEKGRAGQALGDRPLRGRRLVNGPAGPTAIARSADSDDPKPRRHMIEHLADGLTDQVQWAAAAGTGLMFDVDPPFLTRQRCSQARSINPRPASGRPLGV